MQILRETKLEALRKAHKIGIEETLKIIEEKNLRGRGGAAFPVFKKWTIAKNTPSEEKFLICNCDEGEPGTFKDKFIIKNNPKTLVEGMLITAYVIGVKRCFIYLRGEYEFLRESLQFAIDEVIRLSGVDVSIEIVRGAGAYVCGEETAIIQSIMGNRGQSMPKPPYPPVEGLWGKPTVVNNVETLTNVAQCILYDDWKEHMRLFSLSGNVTNPGVYELPLGVKMSSVVDIISPKNNLKFMSFGAFGGIMPVDLNMTIDPTNILDKDCQHGSYTVIFGDENQNVSDICYSLAKFYTYESCGKCTPCREGTIKILNMLKEIRSGNFEDSDLDELVKFCYHVNKTSLCGLGQSCGNHMITAVEHFREDFMRLKK